MSNLIPVLQFSDEALITLSGKAMDELGISWTSVSLDDPDGTEIPDWIDSSLGGWVFFIEEARFAEGMERLGDLMGYSPD
jgi:hypothetical protein